VIRGGPPTAAADRSSAARPIGMLRCTSIGLRKLLAGESARPVATSFRIHRAAVGRLRGACLTNHGARPVSDCATTV